MNHSAPHLMKPTKFIFATMVVALVVWNSSAQVIPGPNSPFEKINFSLIIQQQGVTWGRLSKGYGYYTLLEFNNILPFHILQSDNLLYGMLASPEKLYILKRS